MQIPHVNRQEYTLLDVSEDGYVSVSVAIMTGYFEHSCYCAMVEIKQPNVSFAVTALTHG